MPHQAHPEPTASSAASTSSTSSASSTSSNPIDYCPNCSSKLFAHSCKMKCPRCGYFLSCSDYY